MMVYACRNVICDAGHVFRSSIRGVLQWTSDVSCGVKRALYLYKLFPILD